MEAQERRFGAKKIAIIASYAVEDIREHEVSKSLALGDFERCKACLYNFCLSGGNIQLKDMRTKETFLHVLSDYTHLYLSASATRLFYMLGIKVDMDSIDSNGDTALHKVVRVPGSWRAIIALMRCGANPLIKNRGNRTPEEEILHLKNVGYEENLHWLRKFLPGLWAAVLSRNPDVTLVERLLRYWCRTSKVEGVEAHNLKCVVNMMNAPLDFVCILEKYENTNEMALAMLSGKTYMTDHWKKTKDSVSTVDVNTKDHSYQFHYREYPTAPRPLLAALWEMDDLDLIKSFTQLGPDIAIKYTFESEASSPPKPLFFQLVNPKSRPQNEAITAHILGLADLNMRTVQGRTILMEAMHNSESEGIIQTILNAGVNLAARDGQGLTARDHADALQRSDYRQLIDKRVSELIQSGDAATLEVYILQMYQYVTHNLSKCQITNMLKQHSSKHLAEVLKNSSATQATIQKLFSYIKSGNKAQFMKHISHGLGSCQDKAGRTLLHFAIQHSLNSSHSGKNSKANHHFEDMEVQSGSKVGLVNNMVMNEAEVQENDHPIMHNESRCIIKVLLNHSWRIGAPTDFKPNHFGIIKYLIKEFPYMLDLKNTFGQTPLHYAYIFSASQEIIDLLEKSGYDQNVKDVFDFVPKDYSRELCGKQTFNVRRKATVELDLEIFLKEANFKENLYKAIERGNSEAVKKLALPLLELGGRHKFSHVLFDCLDMGQFDIAWSLVDAGFPSDITKQYESCNPDNPMCAMMECSHAVTTLRQRALDVGALEVVSLVDKLHGSPANRHGTVT